MVVMLVGLEILCLKLLLKLSTARTKNEDEHTCSIILFFFYFVCSLMVLSRTPVGNLQSQMLTACRQSAS